MAIKEDETITYSNMYNEATNKSQLKHEIISSAYNHKYIISAIHEGRAYDISEEPKVNRVPAIIFGSGASLDKALPYLKDWKGGTFCTTSHAESLIRFGVEPTYIIDLDPMCPWSDISDIDWSKTKTKLVMHPGVYTDLVAHWPNEMLLYLENSGDPSSFYSTVQPLMYTERINPELATRDQPLKRLIVTNFSIFACSPPLQMFVAHLLGYDPIFTCGVDFAYTFDKERFTDWRVKKEYLKETGIDPRRKQYTEEEWKNMWYPTEHPLPAFNDNDIIITSNGLKAERIHIYYKKNFISAWRLLGETIYSTDYGAVTEIPFIPIEKVVKQQGLGFRKIGVKRINEIADLYLAKQHCFILEADEGLSFVESNNPLEDIKKYMLEGNSKYVCTVCKKNMLLTDKKVYVNHENEDCPICKSKGSLKRVIHFDIQKNMKRIRSLLKEIKRQ